GAYQSYHAGGIGSGRSAVSEFFESNWKGNMTMNAAIKMGLEALRNSLDSELNREAVEIAIIDSSGYRTLTREDVNKNIDKLKPLDLDE
ncbi:MAG: proteasome subunit alpha, partial [Euryarchaeota archaeon]|nr:proteasome subunit alpha [Euryarchaeota archaeon]